VVHPGGSVLFPLAWKFALVRVSVAAFVGMTKVTAARLERRSFNFIGDCD
jgi:hypothetical protein